jgi:SP family sugar:H+ symporter-like MFS transporter
MYQGETCPKEVRGVMISMYQLFITLGILIASAINLGTKNLSTSLSWRITIAIGMIWPLILAIGILFLDESPRWEIRRDSIESAISTLTRLYSTSSNCPHIRREVLDIRASVIAEASSGKTSMRAIFTETTVLRRILVAMLLQAMQLLLLLQPRALRAPARR